MEYGFAVRSNCYSIILCGGQTDRGAEQEWHAIQEERHCREREKERESLEKDHIAVDVRDLSLIDRVFSLKTELGALHIFAFHNDMGWIGWWTVVPCMQNKCAEECCT